VLVKQMNCCMRWSSTNTFTDLGARWSGTIKIPCALCVDSCGLSAACGSTEDIGVLSLVLQIIDASQELQQTVAHVKKLTPCGSAAAAAAADKDQGPASTDQGLLVMQPAVSRFLH